jgi:heterodisulfide reductase subunit B
MMNSARGANHQLPSILYPQLLGLAMGIDGDALGLNSNKIDISKIKVYLS